MDFEGFKSKIVDYLKKREVQIFLVILIFAAILRLWVFIKTLGQPVWYDEADYLSLANYWSITPNLENVWYFRRTFFLPLFWAGLKLLGGTEALLRFTELVFSFLTIPLTYYVGKEFFNKNVGLFAAFVMASSRIHLFLTGRLLTSVPATCFLLLGMFCFAKGYINKKNLTWVGLAGLFVGLALFTRFGLMLVLVPFVVYFLMNEKFNIYKSKHFWVFFGILLLVLIPFIYNYHVHYGSLFDFIQHYTGIGGAEVVEDTTVYLGLPGIWMYFLNIFQNSGWAIFVFFIVGSTMFFDLIFGYDKIFKNQKLQKYIFLLLWGILPIIYHGLYSEYLQERYLLWAYPAYFMIAGVGVVKFYEFAVKKVKKELIVGVIIVLLVISAYFQIIAGSAVITSKLETYDDVMFAGQWLKENSDPDDLVMCLSRPQIIYYAERDTEVFSKMIEVEFDEYVEENDPDYFIVSMYERHPDWAYTYPEKHQDSMVPVQVYFTDETQTIPSLIIYEFI